MIIYEPIYELNQSLKNFGAEAFLFENIRPEWREFYLITEIYRTVSFSSEQYIGLISPKFSLKTKITLKTFKNFIYNHPGFDVYFINPFPQIAYSHFNIWDQAENAHPGIVAIAQALLNSCGIHWDLSSQFRTDSSILCFCNYWVGNQKLWNNFVGKVLIPIRNFIESYKNPTLINRLFTSTLHTDDAPFFPFIVERLFTTFLHYSSEIKYLHYPTNKHIGEYFLNSVEEKALSQIKNTIDSLDRAGSFSKSEIALMQALGFTIQNYNTSYFSENIYPFTGKVIDKI